MSVIYDMEPSEVLRVIYGNNTDGISQAEFDKNKIDRGIEVPNSIRLYLEKYAYKPVNHQGDITLFHPNIMTSHTYRDNDGTELPIVAVGRMSDYRIAVCEGNIEDPAVFLIKSMQGSVEITLSKTTVFELIKNNIFSVLLKSRSAVSVDDPNQAVKMLRRYGVNFDEIENALSHTNKYMFNFNMEERTFILADLSEGKLSRFVFVGDENFFYNGKKPAV